MWGIAYFNWDWGDGPGGEENAMGTPSDTRRTYPIILRYMAVRKESDDTSFPQKRLGWMNRKGKEAI
ncbi:hypothetical protein EYF80_016936 [Liparis tanakae]|uniref:Uncharacterized protein n=1 Tax=Liparis tanakae TaxID=230148 RepID=A0A4Z2I5U1_9TELE|nr:hypothetical protein EYF80_016936 [Liparis tanakae]